MTEPPNTRRCPAWTVLYNRPNPRSPWIGRGWEFFDDEVSATARFDELVREGCTPIRRPYDRKADLLHLGAVHILRGEG